MHDSPTFGDDSRENIYLPNQPFTRRRRNKKRSWEKPMINLREKKIQNASDLPIKMIDISRYFTLPLDPLYCKMESLGHIKTNQGRIILIPYEHDTTWIRISTKRRAIFATETPVYLLFIKTISELDDIKQQIIYQLDFEE